MNCKNCKNWVFGRCTVSNLIVGPGQLCNAWELSASYEQVKLPYATFDEKEFQKRIAELEAETERLSQLLHDEMSQLEIATDLGNKRWLALNDIYENGEKHNSNWCKRKAQEGLGIKNA